MADFQIQNHGSVALVVPQTAAAREWLDANVEAEGWQHFGGGIAVDPRYVGGLIDAMVDEGMEVN